MHRHATANELYFYRTAAGMRAAASRGSLVRLTASRDLALHDLDFPYVKSTTRLFLTRLAAQYRAACGQRLVVTSAARPKSRQPENASPRSVHPTGIAVDLRRPAGRCLTWLRRSLLSLERGGVIEATEERSPPHFHVAVFPEPYARHVARLTRRSAPSYAVRPGDTLWDIAQEHGVSVAELAEANDLADDTIRPGQELVIP
jgi:LysM repeat protein